MTDAAAPLRSLIEAIYTKTLNGDIDWTFDQQSDVCEASIGDGYFQICSDVDDDGDYYNYLKILNGQKQIIDTVYGGTLGQRAPATGHKNFWELIRDLRTVAHRRAVGSDAVIRSMLTALGAHTSSASGDLNDDIPF